MQCMCCASFLSLQALTAVYGGFFIVLSYAWGWTVDKERPDAGKQTSRGEVAIFWQGFVPTRSPVKPLQRLKHTALPRPSHAWLLGGKLQPMRK